MNISRKTFNQYIASSDFSTLFIREMMWNNPHGQTLFSITIDDVVYSFEQIAQRNGFQVFTCAVNDIPTSSLAKKIDTQLRKQANDYICVYFLPNSQHHLWVVPVKKVEKRDLVLVEYTSAESASFLYEKMDGLSFEIDDTTTIMDVKERVHEAFIVNSEKLTKDFYAGFKKEHSRFAEFITGIDDEIEDIKKNKNKQWYTSVMLNRLMFCYFIQKKGFLDMDENYLRKKLEVVQNEQGENKFYGSFYKGFLRSLFHDGLNSPRHQRDFQQKYGRIPYLNGGMFDEHELEKNYPDIDIDDQAFENLFDFFDKWHWHLDDRITANGRDINPDVLGYIFEQYINDRAQMGAYYTKEDITEYIGRNTIVPFLMDKTKEKSSDSFKTNGKVWKYLQKSGDKYIYDAVKHGHEEPIPEHIAVGIDTTKPNLLERRSRWNERTPEPWALPTEIWRETVERLQRYENIRQKIECGEIKEINDFITYNLDIRQFVYDYLQDTDDHLFVKHFYSALQHVSILDPTCGSGAFLFAALNILEPLYEICITRMQEWNNTNPKLFEEELHELNVKYRSNIRYFIYKSIILRNLYGVDIMVEATEIAKLRLFLKMVAVVDVNPFDDNLGLDPLPDIDFNIRCGNTLVGYATEKEMEKGIMYMDLFARQEFETKIREEVEVVSAAYSTFRKVQLEQDADLETFKNAKKELKNRLANLNDLLNKSLHTSTAPSMDFEKWKKSHQPFHWLAEYYDIIQGNGGFDVIIGNPPYVEYNKKVQGVAVSDIYTLNGYKTIDCGNLYAYVLERSKAILMSNGHISMIVPLSGHSTERMSALVTEFYNTFKYHVHLNLSADAHPQMLFEGVKFRLTIFVASNNGEGVFTSQYRRWLADERRNLFTALVKYNSVGDYKYQNIIPKIPSPYYLTAIKKVLRHKSFFYSCYGEYFCYYHNVPVHWVRSHSFVPYFCSERDGEGITTQLKSIPFSSSDAVKVASSVLNSSIFFIWWICNSDCYHLNKPEISNFKYSNTKADDMDICLEADKLAIDMQRKSVRRVYNYKASGRVEYDEFYMKLSKPIIDEIDKVLAKHYGFTDEELDFIINYDIKYRMGDELGEKGEQEKQPKQEVKPSKEPARLPKQSQRAQENDIHETEPKEEILTMIVRHETLERIQSGEKTTFKRYLDDEEFAKEVLVTENGRIKLSEGNCPYTAKNISSIKMVCDGETLVKKITRISFRTGINQEGKNAWKIVFHF